MPKKPLQRRKPQPAKTRANEKPAGSGTKAFTPKEKREAAAALAAAEGLVKKFTAAISNSNHPDPRTV